MDLLTEEEYNNHVITSGLTLPVHITSGSSSRDLSDVTSDLSKIKLAELPEDR